MKFWPSSTKAELLAILIALIILPPNSRVTIYTDSQAAIDGINKIMNTDILPCQWLKSNNNSLLSNIKGKITYDKLIIKFIKVKGHSGNLINEIVNKLAKDAVQIGKYELDSIVTITNNPQYITHGVLWNEIYIDRPI